MRNSLYSVTLDEALEVVGGHHPYQLQLITQATLFSAAIGITLKSVDFMTSKEAEMNSFGKGNEGEFGPVKELFSLGITLGAVLFGVLVDLIGRRKSLQIAVFLAMISTAVTSASLSSAFLYLSTPLCGFTTAGVFLSTLLSMVEVTDSHYRLRSPAVAVTAIIISYSGLSLLAVFLLQWRTLWMIAAVSWACCLPLTQNVLESPRYLAVIIGKYSQTRAILQEITTINHKSRFTGMLEGEKVIGYQEPSAQDAPENTVSNPDTSNKLAFAPITAGIVSVSQAENTHIKRYFYWHLVLLASLRGNFVGCAVVWMCLSFAECSLVKENERIIEYGGAAGATIGIWLLLLLAQRLGRLHTLLITFIFTGISSLTGLILANHVCSSLITCTLNAIISSSALFVALTGAISAQCILLLYTTERFPSAIRSLILAFYMALWAAISFICPLFQSVLKKFELSPVLLSGLTLLCVCPLLCLLEETLGEEQSDYLQEEQEEMKKPADLSQIDVRNNSPLGTPERHGNPFSFEPINEEHS